MGRERPSRAHAKDRALETDRADWVKLSTFTPSTGTATCCSGDKRNTVPVGWTSVLRAGPTLQAEERQLLTGEGVSS